MRNYTVSASCRRTSSSQFVMAHSSSRRRRHRWTTQNQSRCESASCKVSIFMCDSNQCSFVSNWMCACVCVRVKNEVFIAQLNIYIHSSRLDEEGSAWKRKVAKWICMRKIYDLIGKLLSISEFWCASHGQKFDISEVNVEICIYWVILSPSPEHRMTIGRS